MSILFAKRLNLLAVLRLTVNPIEILVIKYVFIVYHIVREEMNIVRLSHDIVTFDVDRDVSTAILLVFIRQRGRLFTCLHGRT